MMIFFDKITFLKVKAKVFFLLLLITGAFCFGGASRAQEDLAIATAVQVSPIRFDWDLNTGEERSGVVNLKNYAAEPYDVEIQSEDFYVTDDTTEARFFIPNEKHPLFAYDVINWIEMPENLTLAPGEGKDIYFKIKVPEGMPTGGYYGALFFKTSKHDSMGRQADENQSRVIVNQRVGVLLVFAVKGKEPIKKTGELQKFEPTQKIFWANPAKLEAVVANSGNIHYKAMGLLEIHKFGSKIDNIKIDPRMIYPQKYRKYETKWNFSPWAFGYYKAKFQLFSEDMQVRIEGETNFWVIPWKTTVAIIILLLIIWMIYKIFDSRFEIRKKGDDDGDHGTHNREHEAEKQIRHEHHDENWDMVELKTMENGMRYGRQETRMDRPVANDFQSKKNSVKRRIV
jgi:hypothetical protein